MSVVAAQLHAEAVAPSCRTWKKLAVAPLFGEAVALHTYLWNLATSDTSDQAGAHRVAVVFATSVGSLDLELELPLISAQEQFRQ